MKSTTLPNITIKSPSSVDVVTSVKHSVVSLYPTSYKKPSLTSQEGAALIRTKGEAGTGDVVEAVRHVRTVQSEIRKASVMSEEELIVYAKEIGASFHLLKETAKLKRLPVVNFAAGGVATPADAAMMMQLGCDGVFVGSGVFKSGDPAKRARAIVQAVTHYKVCSRTRNGT